MKNKTKQNKNYSWNKGFLSGALAAIYITIASRLFSIVFKEDISSNLKTFAVVGSIILLICSARLLIKYFRNI